MNKISFIVYRTLFIALLSIAGIEGVSAQDSIKKIYLREAINAALKNNRAIQLAGIDERMAASSYKETEAIYLPEIGFSYSAMNTNNPLNAFGFSLQQKSITQADFDPARLNHPSGTTDFTTKLTIQQPIINMDMLYKRKAAEKQMALYQLKTQRTKEYLVFEVQKAYLQLQWAYDAVTVLEEALTTSKAVYQFTNNHFQQGLIQKSDLLQVQVQVSTVETNLAKAKSSVSNASDYLGLLMGDEKPVIYKTSRTDSLPATLPGNVQKIKDSRSDFMAMQKAIESSDLMIKSSRMSYLPRVNAFGSYQFNDSRALGFGANAYLAGIQLSWDIFKGNRTKNSLSTQKLARNKIEEELKKQKEQSQLELNKALRDLSDAQFDIKQQTTAVEQATESLQILQNRYQQGLVNTTDVLQAASRQTQQKFSLVQACYTLNMTQYYIQFLTASDHP
jgi:outer membrane protein TolC